MPTRRDIEPDVEYWRNTLRGLPSRTAQAEQILDHLTGYPLTGKITKEQRRADIADVAAALLAVAHLAEESC